MGLALAYPRLYQLYDVLVVVPSYFSLPLNYVFVRTYWGFMGVWMDFVGNSSIFSLARVHFQFVVCVCVLLFLYLCIAVWLGLFVTTLPFESNVFLRFYFCLIGLLP